MAEKLEQKFEENLRHWKAFIPSISCSSIITDYLNCEAYRNIVALGEEVLPLIRKEIDSEVAFARDSNLALGPINRRLFGSPSLDYDGTGQKFAKRDNDPEYQEWQAKYGAKLIENPSVVWVTAVKEIVGEEFQIPSSIRGNVSQMIGYTLGWLDAYLARKK